MLTTLAHEVEGLKQIPSSKDLVFGASQGEFLGIGLMARDFAAYIEPYWPNQRIKAVACALSESRLRVGAYNLNKDANGNVLSEDCGVFQNNISAYYIGTDVEKKLRTDSRDKAVWEPVVKNNVKWAYGLWSSPTDWRDGKRDFRRWRPWYGYNWGWATHPRCYVWHHEIVNGVLVPMGPWVKAGMHLHKALRGVANHDIVNKGKKPNDVLEWVKFQAESNWGIPSTWCEWKYSFKDLIYFIPEKQPTEPPTAHENWGYPMKNDGR